MLMASLAGLMTSAAEPRAAVAASAAAQRPTAGQLDHLQVQADLDGLFRKLMEGKGHRKAEGAVWILRSTSRSRPCADPNSRLPSRWGTARSPGHSTTGTKTCERPPRPGAGGRSQLTSHGTNAPGADGRRTVMMGNHYEDAVIARLRKLYGR
jgi:hypothetical protein